MKIVLCIFILYIQSCPTKKLLELDKQEDITSAKKILNITADIIKDTDRRIGLLLTEQKEASGCAAFEVGYLTYVLHEKFRRMVDKYNVSHYMLTRLYLSELVLYLDEIEHHYWEISHVSNMLHEIPAGVCDVHRTLQDQQEQVVATRLRLGARTPVVALVNTDITSARILIISWLDVTSEQKQYNRVLDLMTSRDKQKLVTLCHELVAEAKLKVHQTDRLRDNMSTRLGFQIGMIMGQIREKYKTMLELYRQMNNKHTNKSRLILPNVPERRPIHYLWRMEYISALEIDIDRLVHILEQLPLEYVEDYHEVQIHRQNRTRKLKTLRTEESAEDFETLARKEREVKRNYRQQFLRERLGLPANISMENYPHMDNQ